MKCERLDPLRVHVAPAHSDDLRRAKQIGGAFEAPGA